MAESQKLIFMGTSGFAADILAALMHAGKNIAAVYTQPDRPAGRGLGLRKSAVKILAESSGLDGKIRQPVNFKADAAMRELAALKPDFFIVAAYGLILPQAVLDIPAVAPVNIHASLLPKYRGAAPIQRAIMENWQPDAVTGVSIMRMEAGLDAGPVYATRELLLEGETAGTLEAKLAGAGAELLLEILPEIAAGALLPVPQDRTLATYARKLVKADGAIDWRQPAAAVHARVRAVTPWPGARVTLNLPGRSAPMTLLPGLIGERTGNAAQPGAVKVGRKGMAIACADNWYELSSVVPQGRRKMTAQAFANGLRLAPGIIGEA